MATLLSLVLWLVIVGVLFWAATRLIALVPIAEPFRTVIYVVLVVIAVIVLIYAVGNLLGVGIMPGPIVVR